MSWHPYPGRYESMQYRYCGKSGLRLPALSRPAAAKYLLNTARRGRRVGFCQCAPRRAL